MDDEPVVLPMDVWCPYCGAMPPAHCTTKRGHRADAPHEARIERAVAEMVRARARERVQETS